MGSQRSIDELVGQHHQLNGHELALTPGDSDGQGSLACCGPQGHKELDMLEHVRTTTKENANDESSLEITGCKY